MIFQLTLVLDCLYLLWLVCIVECHRAWTAHITLGLQATIKDIGLSLHMLPLAYI